MFRSVDTGQNFPKLEEEVLRFWKENAIFRKSVEQRPEERPYVFYEGPPTANARPGVHHVLARVFKDLFPRYKTMRGYRVERKAGWDTHGLPVELEVERELGLKSKTEIEEFGIEEFNRRCRESVFRYVKDWEALTERIGFWVDMEIAYITYDNDYIESVWWMVQRLWEHQLLYQDYRSTPHCPRCGTSLSDAEVALGYKEDTPDPSVYVKFRLTDEAIDRLWASLGLQRQKAVPISIVAWTTTPWTLPGNTALAVNPDADYVIYGRQSEFLIVASERLNDVLHPADAERLRQLNQQEQSLKQGELTPEEEQRTKEAIDAERASILEAQTRGPAGEEGLVHPDFPGTKLVGLRYQALYNPTQWAVQAMAFRPGPSLKTWEEAQEDIELTGGSEWRRLEPVGSPREVDTAYTVIGANFVSLEDGTGIVHVAPAFGGDDFELGKERGLLFLQPVDLRGRLPEGSPWPGQFVKDADKGIMDDLAGRGLLLLPPETIRHTYPFCWRCDTPLLYYAKPTWYIRTTAVKDRMIAGNERINWYPEHIKRGRFGDWLRNNVDWALSRERYWGTPLPVWQCTECSERVCIGSRSDMRDLAVDVEAVNALEDLHRPYIDRIELRCEPTWIEELGEGVGCGGIMRRVPEVMDAWFDSGAMPYAQRHYPFENVEAFRRAFPADFICEAVDQTRGWFYTLHAEAVLLNHMEEVPEGIAYRNVICLGHIQDDKGRKMSKSVGNVVEPMSVIEHHGADALRWYLYTATRPGEARRFSDKLVSESLRRFLLTLWNIYSFFVTYANLDRFDPSTAEKAAFRERQGERSELDRWVLSELSALVRKVTDCLEDYDPTTSGRAIQQFVDDLSNWYVRRSRRRFWKSGADADKLGAYQTLYTCLATVTKLLAPFTPFVAEAMYQNLVRTADPEAPESVHLAAWPDASPVDEGLMHDTRLVMRVVSLGRAARSKAGIKVRQPLAAATAFVHNAAQAEGLRRLEGQVLDELNVKRLEVIDAAEAFKGRNAVEHPKDLVALLPEGAALTEDDAGYAVGLDTKITPELADEGLARELVHRIQNARKAAGFEISDRIAVYYSGSERLRSVLAVHAEYVRAETLADEIAEGTAPEGAHVEEQALEGEPVTLAVSRSS